MRPWLVLRWSSRKGTRPPVPVSDPSLPSSLFCTLLLRQHQPGGPHQSQAHAAARLLSLQSYKLNKPVFFIKCPARRLCYSNRKWITTHCNLDFKLSHIIRGSKSLMSKTMNWDTGIQISHLLFVENHPLFIHC